MNEPKINPLMLLLALAGLWLAFGDTAGVQEWAELHISGRPSAPAEPEPSDTLKGKVLPVRTALAGQPEKAAALAAYFAGVARCVAADAGQTVATTLEFERANRNGLTILCKGKGWGTDIGGQVDEIIAAHLELTREGDHWLPAALDEGRRQKLVDVLKALSWACE